MNKNELRNTILSQIQLPCIGKNRMQVEPVPGQMQTRQLQQAIDDLSRQGGAGRRRRCRPLVELASSGGDLLV